MIRAVIFDNNGVLVTSNEESAFLAIKKLVGNKLTDFINIYTELAKKLDEGSLKTKKFFEQIASEASLGISPKKLEEVAYGSFVRKEDSINFALRIKNKYEIALLTNFGDRFWDLDKRWGVSGIFDSDKIFVSCKIGLRKPDPKIFIYVLKRLGLSPGEVVFFDDNLDNIKAARKLGIHAVLFQDADSAERELSIIEERENV